MFIKIFGSSIFAIFNYFSILLVDKEEKIKLRKKALTEYRRYQEEKEKSKNEMKNDLKKFGVKEQIKVISN